LLRRINELTIRELSQAQDHMVLLGRRSAEEKVATFLIGWRDRLAQFGSPSRVVPLPMSRQDIADYLGLTIETVSRTFTKLERDGVIEIMPGSVCLVNPARAEALAAA
jgi:CRP/FNR family transcriptional regulator